MKIVIATIADYAREKYTVSTWCWKCAKSGKPLDLAGLCAKGYGPTRLSAYRPKCPKCGVELQKTVSPPVNQGGRPGFLLKG